MSSYTHDFEIVAGEESVEGEIEFNLDGQASYALNEGERFSNLTLAQSCAINDFFRSLRGIFVEFGSIDKVEIKEK